MNASSSEMNASSSEREAPFSADFATSSAAKVATAGCAVRVTGVEASSRAVAPSAVSDFAPNFAGEVSAVDEEGLRDDEEASSDDEEAPPAGVEVRHPAEIRVRHEEEQLERALDLALEEYAAADTVVTARDAAS